MATSGSYNWTLDVAGLVTEAFGRCGISPTALTREHFISATRSINLTFARWSNLGVNLWQVDLQSIVLEQGVPTYTCPSNTVNVLDAYIETYSLETTVSGAPNFTTVLGSDTVTVNIANHDLVAGNWINVIVPVAIGGIVIQGLYQASVILNPNQFTILTPDVATASVSNGGAVPIFTTTLNSETINVNLPNHGLLAGNTFVVQQATTVGGLLLIGNFVVANVIDANNFTMVDYLEASGNDVQPENLGLWLVMTQANSNAPIDRVMTPMSRTDYSAIPNKLEQATPTSYWYDRQSPLPSFTLWQTPDGNGPYVLFYYRMRRIQDASPANGQTADIPYRFLEATVADLAARLARKHAPALAADLKMEAKEMWEEAANEDRERVQMFLVPDTSGYYQ